MTMNADIPGSTRGPSLLEDALDPSRRIVVANVAPSVDQGRYPAKRCIGDALTVEADIFADGHEKLAARLTLHSPSGEISSAAMKPLGNDRWAAVATLDETGCWEFSVEAWLDIFGGFVRDTIKK